MSMLDKSRSSTFTVGLLLFVSVLFVSGCQDQGASRSGKEEADRTEKQELREKFPRGHFWLNVKVDQFKGSYTILCNGFPVKKMWVNIIEADDEWATDMQTALIGEGNVASIRIRPFLDYSGKRLTVGTAQLKAWVEIEETRQSYVPLHKVQGAEGEGRIQSEAVDSMYTVWEKQVRKQWKRLLKEKPTPKEAFVQLKTWRWNHPMEVKTTPFKSRHGPDFSQIFEEAPKLKGTPATRSRLKDYAMYLREVISNRDGLGLYREIRPAQNASYRQVGKTPPPDSVRRAKWKKAARKKSGWFADVRGATAFDREQVGLRPWVHGRVWELYQKPGDPLFGGWKIYVGKVNGELKVVRLE